MRIKKIYYCEYAKDTTHNYWELDDLILGNLNLIVGKNATGKTRTSSVIMALAQIINNQVSIDNGEWNIKFLTRDNVELDYELVRVDGKVLKEKLIYQGKEKLIRSENRTKIYSEVVGEQFIEPPDDKLVLQVRRDRKEHPYFEFLYEWAANTIGYRFGKFDPSSIKISNDKRTLLNSLEAVPSIFEKMSEESIKKVIIDFNKIGYEIEGVQLGVQPNLPFTVKLIFLKEKGLVHPIPQMDISSGMFRAFALLVVLQYMLDTKEDEGNTVIVDDFGEGLDYERATNLAKLVFNKMDKKNIQFITTTNDRFLMNSVDIENWNILKRESNKVTAMNYLNSKKIFDEFKLTGLSNFDLFSSDYLSKK